MRSSDWYSTVIQWRRQRWEKERTKKNKRCGIFGRYQNKSLLVLGKIWPFLIPILRNSGFRVFRVQQANHWYRAAARLIQDWFDFWRISVNTASFIQWQIMVCCLLFRCITVNFFYYNKSTTRSLDKPTILIQNYQFKVPSQVDLCYVLVDIYVQASHLIGRTYVMFLSWLWTTKTSILASNWETVANDSLLTVPKTKEGISLAPPPVPLPLMLLHSTMSHDAGCVTRCWLCHTMLAVSHAKQKIDQKLATLKGRGGVKGVFIFKCCPNNFGQDCCFPRSKNVPWFG